MKNLILPLKTLIYFGILIFFSINMSAQKKADTLKVPTENIDEFTDYNTFLASTPSLKLRKLKKKALLEDNKLTYKKDGKSFSIRTHQYLKTLKRIANRSRTFEDFEKHMLTRFPKLKSQIVNDKSLGEIYTFVRSKTFNGYVTSLPSAL